MSGQLNNGQLNDGRLNGRLNEPAYSLDKQPEPHPSSASPWEGAGGELARWRESLPEVAAILAIFVGAGAVCGLLWEWLWSPPTGVAYHHEWILDRNGLTVDFSGTGLYVVIAAVVGLVLGLVVALVFDHDEVVTLGALVLGGVLAAGVMWLVGTSLGPPDPHTVAKTAADFEPVAGDLRVHGKGSFLALPMGSLVGATISLFSFARRHVGPHG